MTNNKQSDSSSNKNDEKKKKVETNPSSYGERQMMTVCFTYTNTNQRAVVKVSPSSCTVADLYELARQNQKEKDPSQSIRLKFGFPPRPLPIEQEEAEGTTTIDQMGIRSNERILVETVSTSEEAEHAKNMNKATKTASMGRRTKRKAAVAATESFASIIAEQDRMIKQEQPSSSPSSKKKKPSTASSTAQRHFSQLNKRSASSSAAAAAPRRLRDGAPVQTSSYSKRNHSSKSSAKTSTKDNLTSLEETLVNMTAGGGNSSQAARLMRSNWRQAVQSAYEQNIAVSRLACTSHTWTTFISQVQWKIVSSSSDIDGIQDKEDIPISKQPQLRVIFPKGVLGRGTMEDVVDCIDITVLRAVVPDIYQHSTEGLRPNNLALLSPRVYWSILYQYTQHVLKPTSSSFSHSPSTSPPPLDSAFSWETVLTWVAPSLDWKFLRRRKLQLSEKARENLRQKQEQETNQPDWEAAAAAIDSVEQAMETMEMANNATNMMKSTQPSRLDWQVPTPSDDVDLEELQACIASYTTDEGNEITKDHRYRVSDIVRTLCEDFHIHNWRQLAIVDMTPEELCQRMIEKLMSSQPTNDAIADDKDPYISITARAVEAWIDHAQGESVEEIMVEICGGNPRAVEYLRDAAKSGTPKELASWSGIESTLRQQIELNLDRLEYPFVNGQDEIPTVETFQTWCLRAQNAVEQFEWLTWYATPL
jgi:hypothetical protein